MSVPEESISHGQPPCSSPQVPNAMASPWAARSGSSHPCASAGGAATVGVAHASATEANRAGMPPRRLVPTEGLPDADPPQLYLGYDRRWKGPKTLHGALGLDEGDPLSPYVTDLRLNLFEVAWLEDEQVGMLQSDFRVVADYLVKRRKYGKEYLPSAQELDHVETVVELIGAMTGDSRYKDALEEARARGKEVTTMDALIDSLLEKGEAKRERELVLRMIEKGGVDDAWIAEVSGLTVGEVSDIARDARRPPGPR